MKGPTHGRHRRSERTFRSSHWILRSVWSIKSSSVSFLNLTARFGSPPFNFPPDENHRECFSVFFLIPHLRRRVNDYPMGRSTNSPRSYGGGCCRQMSFRSPCEVGEGFVGFRHLVDILAFLDRLAFVLRCGDDLVGEFFRGGSAFLRARGFYDPAECEEGTAIGAHFARYLIVGTADASGANLHDGTGVP